MGVFNLVSLLVVLMATPSGLTKGVPPRDPTTLFTVAEESDAAKKKKKRGRPTKEEVAAREKAKAEAQKIQDAAVDAARDTESENEAGADSPHEDDGAAAASTPKPPLPKSPRIVRSPSASNHKAHKDSISDVLLHDHDQDPEDVQNFCKWNKQTFFMSDVAKKQPIIDAFEKFVAFRKKQDEARDAIFKSACEQVESAEDFETFFDDTYGNEVWNTDEIDAEADRIVDEYNQTDFVRDESEESASQGEESDEEFEGSGRRLSQREVIEKNFFDEYLRMPDGEDKEDVKELACRKHVGSEDKLSEAEVALFMRHSKAPWFRTNIIEIMKHRDEKVARDHMSAKVIASVETLLSADDIKSFSREGAVFDSYDAALNACSGNNYEPLYQFVSDYLKQMETKWRFEHCPLLCGRTLPKGKHLSQSFIGDQNIVAMIESKKAGAKKRPSSAVKASSAKRGRPSLRK